MTMKRLELRLAFAGSVTLRAKQLCLRFSCYCRGLAWAIMRVGSGSYVPACISERPDFPQLGSTRLRLHRGTCRPYENSGKATRRYHSYPLAGEEKPGLGCHSHRLCQFLLTQNFSDGRGCGRDG